MRVLPPACEDEEAAGGGLDDGLRLPVSVEELEEPALKVRPVLGKVDEARIIVLGRVVLVHVGVPARLSMLGEKSGAISSYKRWIWPPKSQKPWVLTSTRRGRSAAARTGSR